ncbi:MAG: hypothetical protein JWR49_1821 [Tardiphaga sp.]|nr:hypothetical protein [Tardiphaga sp.]
MIDPGRLKTRFTIQVPIEEDDGQGGVLRSYSTQATVWAAVLTLQHRLVDGARVYRIVSLRDIDDRRFTEIDAELRVE